MTTATATPNRDQEIQAIHTRYADFYKIAGGLSLIIIGVLIGGWLFGSNTLKLAPDLLGYVTNVSTELLSVVATIAVIDQLNRRRDREERKLELFRQAKSRSNDAALEAVDQILHDDLWVALLDHYRDKNGRVDFSQVQWQNGIQLQSANLEKANLKTANLEKADLIQANFEKVHLGRANLQAADLREANLQQANLIGANLQEADLRYANLQQANLRFANLQNADLYLSNLQQAELEQSNLQQARLWQSNLQEANLHQVNLQEANLHQANLRDATNIEYARFDEKTVLPDAKNVGTSLEPEYDKYWTPDTDMTRYTETDHVVDYLDHLRLLLRTWKRDSDK